MSDNSKFIFGTCVSNRSEFEYKHGDKVFSPIGFAEIVENNDGAITVLAARPSTDETETFYKSEIEHVSVKEWPHYYDWSGDHR